LHATFSVQAASPCANVAGPTPASRPTADRHRPRGAKIETIAIDEEGRTLSRRRIAALRDD